MGKYHGSVRLPFVYEIAKVTVNDQHGFRLGVSMWLNAKKKESGRRDIVFACDSSEERDKWIAAIDYLKTRAIYEAYSKNNKLVSFMGQDVAEDHKEDEAEVDYSGLLYDFGDNFKR